MNKGYKLSDLQRRLWILWQLGDEDISYNSNSAVEFKGNFRVELVMRVFKTIIERHEALRTVFFQGDQEVLQRIQNPEDLDFNIDFRDFKGHSEADLHAEIKKQFNYKFDLENGPLIRVCILTIHPERYMMLLSLHHIISDGWSIQNLAREFSILYNDYAGGMAHTLPPLKLQFKDLIRSIQDDAGMLGKAYWENKFKGEIPLLQLPLDRKRPAVKSSSGARLFLALNAVENEQIKDFAAENQVSVFVVLLSALKTLIFRYSGQNDQVIGIPVANRHGEGVEAVIGCFVNTLLLRTTFDPKGNFYALIESVSQNLLETFEHHNYPFDQLVKDLKIERDPGRSPLFDISVNFQEFMVNPDEFRLDDVHMRGFETTDPLSKFDIEIDIIESEEQININFTYNKELFDEWRMQRMLKDLRSLLLSLTRQPYIALDSIDFLSNEDCQLLIRDFNQTTVVPIEEDFVSLFEKAADRYPNKLAVKYLDQVWSYRDLEERANAVWHYLKTRYNLQAGTKVGICAKHHPWLFPIYLGIMKGAGCFVPLNVNYPESQLSMLAQRDQLSLLISDGLSFDQKDTNDLVVLTIDDLIAGISGYETKRPLSPCRLDFVAYMIYTSGSTGVPKGVEIFHKSLVNYLQWVNENYYHSTSGYPTSLFTSLSSDLTITSLFAPLLRGDSVEVFDDLVDEALFKSFDGQRQIKTVKITPSHINLLEEMIFTQATCIEVVVVGGEELLDKHVRILKSLNPLMKIYNEYGPTECTVGCIVEDIDLGNPLRSIGKPIRNTCIYVLNDNLQLQPIGVAGEIYISGIGLAKGYLNNQLLTRQSFIPVPFEDTPYHMMYRSGDLGLWQPGGYLEFLGRKDGQVKIKGYRVELAEIESVLEKYPGVSKAVTVEKKIGERSFLAAYLLGNYSHDNDKIRQFVLDYLPEYMLPEVFMEIDKIPLAASGKINKSALPEIVLTKQTYVSAGNEVEEAVLEIWKKFLKLEKLGIDDNFFEAGGDSILVLRIHKAILESFGEVLSVVDLFRYNSVRRQSAVIIEKRGLVGLTSSHNLEV